MPDEDDEAVGALVAPVAAAMLASTAGCSAAQAITQTPRMRITIRKEGKNFMRSSGCNEWGCRRF